MALFDTCDVNGSRLDWHEVATFAPFSISSCRKVTSTSKNRNTNNNNKSNQYFHSALNIRYKQDTFHIYLSPLKHLFLFSSPLKLMFPLSMRTIVALFVTIKLRPIYCPSTINIRLSWITEKHVKLLTSCPSTTNFQFDSTQSNWKLIHPNIRLLQFLNYYSWLLNTAYCYVINISP